MEKTTDQEILLCHRCKVPLVAQKTFFKYLGHSVFISESLAKGRMAQVEQELEDK